MKLVVHVTIEPDEGEGGDVTTVEVATVERTELQSGNLGLALAEAKQLLAGVQEVMVAEQAAQAVSAVEYCSCGRRHRHKDSRTIVCRTLFGVVRVASPRWWHCPCQPHEQATFSPLVTVLPSRCSPELVLIETQLAALMSFRLCARVLNDLLPVGRRLRPAEPHRRVAEVAARLDSELGPEQVSFIDRPRRSLPRPDLPIVVSIDGGYVHSTLQTSRRDGWFQAIVGTVTKADGSSSQFGFVPAVDRHRRRRLYDQLTAQGMQPNQQITFITDGADDVRDLTDLMNANSEHILDWFHITMRLTVMTQIAKGLTGTDTKPNLPGDVVDQLGRVKRFVWHGNLYRARSNLDDIRFLLEGIESSSVSAKLLRHVRDFDRYLELNAGSIPNYGERHRAGEPISSAPAEGAVNAVIARRMVKKQQMRWSPNGAHRLLQIRCRVLNDQLASDFQRWHSNLTMYAKAA